MDNPNKKLFIVLTTEGSLAKAEKLANAILEKKLAGCINFNETKSFYWWEGKITNAEEVQLLIKTNKSKLNSLIFAINKYHSYDIPELLFFELNSSSSYCDWLGNSIG